MKKRIIFLLFILAVPGGRAFCGRLPESIIRVGVIIRAATLNLSCEGPYRLGEAAAGEEPAIAPLNDCLVRADGDNIVIDGKAYNSPVRIIPGEDNSSLRLNGRRYRDTLSISADNGKLTVVNELGLEDYLYGILPREASPSWPPESLKAQAVISRTYVLKNLRRHAKEGFDVCTQTHCQVYGGVESEDPRSNRAVDETRAEVLVYEGELAQTLFHAACGGHTEDPNNVWSWDRAAPAYLRGCKDKYCRVNNPHEDWHNTLKAELIETRLAKAGYKVGTIKSIKISGRSSSGRARILKIRHSGGSLDVPAGKFRLAVDAWQVKSTLFSKISRRGDSFEFSGRGWGHGVGLCQWGAKAMAEEGHEYQDILEYFYPGTAVETWDE